MKYETQFQRLYDLVKSTLASASGCHDFDHTLRVLKNARLLAAMETGADIQVVEIAALLHDIARPEEINSKGKLCHAALGAERAKSILHDLEFDDDFSEKVIGCIRKHRFRDKHIPSGIEEKIIFDADKLDSLGAVGIGRAFYFAGREGARLHNSSEEALSSAEYSREDSAYREYLVKLRHLEGKMTTESGKKLAESRAEFMHRFFSQLNQEAFE